MRELSQPGVTGRGSEHLATALPPHIPTPSGPLVPTLLAESAWIYLVFRSFLALFAPGVAFSPMAVLAPYGAAALTAILLGIWARWTDRIWRPGTSTSPPMHAPTGMPGTLLGRALKTLRLIIHHPSLITLLSEVAMSIVNLLACVASLLAVTWWEIYRDHPLLDLSWVHLALEEAEGSAGTIPPLWLWAIGIFLWWRGTHLAREGDDFIELVSRFILGAAALLAIAVLGVATPLGPETESWSIVAYILFGLMALAAARLDATQQGRSGRVDANWGWGAPVLALLVLAAGFGVASFLLPQLGHLAGALRDWVAGFLLPLLQEALRWFSHLLGLDQPPPPLPTTTPVDATREIREARDVLLSPPEWLREVVRRLFDLTWISLLLYGLYSWVKHWRWKRWQGQTGGLTRERTPWRFHLSPRALLRWLLQTLLARWPGLSRWIRRIATPGERARTVRQLYRKLLAWGATRGLSREPWATPREYQAALSTRWPVGEGDFRTITESYLRVRYGGITIGEDEMAAAEAGWLRIEMEVARTSSK